MQLYNSSGWSDWYWNSRCVITVYSIIFYLFIHIRWMFYQSILMPSLLWGYINTTQGVLLLMTCTCDEIFPFYTEDMWAKHAYTISNWFITNPQRPSTVYHHLRPGIIALLFIDKFTILRLYLFSGLIVISKRHEEQGKKPLETNSSRALANVWRSARSSRSVHLHESAHQQHYGPDLLFNHLYALQGLSCGISMRHIRELEKKE